jgi:hypothetical protein
MALTAANIKMIASLNGMTVSTVIPSQFEEVEYLAVRIEDFTTAFFLMNNETFLYEYSHTYNALTDKTTKRIPKQFKS